VPSPQKGGYGMGGVLQMDDWLITQQKEKLVA
ncbi:MAG: hypothetical protein RL610_1098, partial [Pseudomonadota bacterium]